MGNSIVPQRVLINTNAWPLQKQRCRYFLRGYCNKAAKCSFLHARPKSSSLSSWYSESDSSDSTSLSPPATPKSHTRSMKVHTPIPQKVIRRPHEIQCWYYLYDHCKFGDRCVNAHGPPKRNFPICPALPRTGPILAPVPVSPTSSTRSSFLPELERIVQRTASIDTTEAKPLEVITIDEALELDMEDDNRMMAYLDRDLRAFIVGS
ncbi:hypothetical protein MRB53_039780 [Persea americana]|nr:hypothetical protein MRB53_039780 [Persea americana]